jgi:hypothetical protein
VARHLRGQLNKDQSGHGVDGGPSIQAVEGWSAAENTQAVHAIYVCTVGA